MFISNQIKSNFACAYGIVIVFFQSSLRLILHCVRSSIFFVSSYSWAWTPRSSAWNTLLAGI